MRSDEICQLDFKIMGYPGRICQACPGGVGSSVSQLWLDSCIRCREKSIQWEQIYNNEQIVRWGKSC